MRPHELEPSSPVEVDLERVADGRRVPVRRVELVDDLAVELARGTDRPGPPVRGAKEQPPIRRLTAATRVEDRPVEDDERGFAGIDRADARLRGARIRVRVAELLAGRGHRRTYWTVSVPVMFECTVHTNG